MCGGILRKLPSVVPRCNNFRGSRPQWVIRVHQAGDGDSEEGEAGERDGEVVGRGRTRALHDS